MSAPKLLINKFTVTLVGHPVVNLKVKRLTIKGVQYEVFMFRFVMEIVTKETEMILIALVVLGFVRFLYLP